MKELIKVLLCKPDGTQQIEEREENIWTETPQEPVPTDRQRLEALEAAVLAMMETDKKD